MAWSQGLGGLARENNYTKQPGDLNHRADGNTETGLETEADAGGSHLLSSGEVSFFKPSYLQCLNLRRLTIVLNSDTSKNELTNLLYDHLVLISVGHFPGFSTELERFNSSEEQFPSLHQIKFCSHCIQTPKLSLS
jgi:hypothetical protein